MPEVPAVSIRNLTRIFRLPTLRRQIVTAVDDVSFDIAPGQIYGLIGPNGSGKSTTMKVLLGLLRATKGACAIFGRNSGRVDSREEVGFLPENPYFYRHLTGRETLAFYGKLCGIRGRELKDRTGELLKLVELEAAADRRLSGYSKGMLQRIGLAQAIIHRPRLVVLDEPTAGVDPGGSRKIRDLILTLRSQGITVILSSHLLEQVQEVCDRVGIIYKGKLVREGLLSDLMSIEDQTEILLRNATPEVLAAVRALIAGQSQTELLHLGNPRTTLERLFLDVTGGSAADSREYQK